MGPLLYTRSVRRCYSMITSVPLSSDVSSPAGCSARTPPPPPLPKVMLTLISGRIAQDPRVAT